MGAVRKGGSFLMAAETGGEFGFRQWRKRRAAREACCYVSPCWRLRGCTVLFEGTWKMLLDAAEGNG